MGSNPPPFPWGRLECTTQDGWPRFASGFRELTWEQSGFILPGASRVRDPGRVAQVRERFLRVNLGAKRLYSTWGVSSARPGRVAQVRERFSRVNLGAKRLYSTWGVSSARTGRVAQVRERFLRVNLGAKRLYSTWGVSSARPA
jgi:hypothetical protein